VSVRLSQKLGKPDCRDFVNIVLQTTLLHSQNALFILPNVQFKFLNTDSTNLLFFVGSERSEAHDQ
jgi:hypothetical protein